MLDRSEELAGLVEDGSEERGEELRSSVMEGRSLRRGEREIGREGGKERGG